MSSRVSSLLVGDRLVSRCDDGLLEAEYALFDRSEVLVSPGVREEGYMTTAGFARVRLAKGLVTTALAHEAFAAMQERHLRPLARSAAVLGVVDQLGPYEAFQGARFVAGRGRYTGLWLDLDALAAACPLRDAALLFQALHLAMLLDEVPEGAPVRLLTSRSGSEDAGRTWRRVDLELAQRVPWVLREMKPPPRSHGTSRDEAEVREEILRDLQARATGAATVQPRLKTLAAAIARTGSTPPAALPDPLPHSRTIISSRPPAPAEVAPSRDAQATIQQARDLLRGTDSLLTVAQSVTALLERSPFLPDLAILAARAWLAAGEPGSARHYARLVVDDASAADEVRILALEIINATQKAPDSAPPAAIRRVLDAGSNAGAPLAVVPRGPETALALRTVTPTDGLLDGRRALDPRLVLLQEPASQRAAGFRLLRDHLLAKTAPRIIAVSSGGVNEGKTTCALNLALALSERPPTRVLLMDGNFFAPSLGDVLGIDAGTPIDPELSPPFLAPYRVVQMQRGFHVAALVRRAGEPPPAFNGRWFEKVMEYLSSADYDHIVIDTAALDGSPGVTELLGAADGVLLTARSHTTTARNLRRAAAQIPEGRALGVTLMDSDT